MALQRLADYVADRLTQFGITHAFLVTGGGSMHLNDAFARHKKLTTICFHHEQAAAMAAESYYRSSNRLALLNVTTGPGGINALNGVYGAYVDSCAMIVISGQVKLETHYKQYSIPMRQLGDQEIDIIAMANPVIKYGCTVKDAKDIKMILDQALWLSVNGRPGPVWIDIPIDISSMQIDSQHLQGWPGDIESLKNSPYITDNTKLELETYSNVHRNHDIQIDKILDKLKKSRCPVLFAGAGIRLSGQYHNFLKLSKQLSIPTVTGWNAHDALPNDHECYAGRPGTVGDRAGNFTVQNADFILVLGSRLNIRQISYNFKNFAKKAYKIHVDIDRAELDKPTLKSDLTIQADLKDFIPAFLHKLVEYQPMVEHKRFLTWCKERVIKYPVVLPHYQHKDLLNPYKFINDLFLSLDKDDIVVTANGSACVIPFQTGKIKQGQRLYTNSGDASMGYDLPAAIGASFANPGKRIICIAGDGSIMMNLQELETIKNYGLPIKIILLNNNGYLSIKQTQQNYFNDNQFGTDFTNGLSLPDFVRIADAFDIKSRRIEKWEDWTNNLVQNSFTNNEPMLYNVIVDPEQQFAPKLAAKKLSDGSMLAPSLENMSPFLPDEEMHNNIYE